MPPRILLVVAGAELPGVEDRDGGLVLIVLGLLAVALAAVILCVAYFWVTGQTARKRFAAESPLPPAPSPTGFYGDASTQAALLDAAPRPVVTNAPPPAPAPPEPFGDLTIEPGVFARAPEVPLDVPFAGRRMSADEPIDIEESSSDAPPVPVIQALDGIPLPDEIGMQDQVDRALPVERPTEFPNW